MQRSSNQEIQREKQSHLKELDLETQEIIQKLRSEITEAKSRKYKDTISLKKWPKDGFTAFPLGDSAFTELLRRGTQESLTNMSDRSFEKDAVYFDSFPETGAKTGMAEKSFGAISLMPFASREALRDA